MTAIVVVALGGVALSTPIGGAHHGSYGFGTAELPDGTEFTIAMRFDRETQNQQVWEFTFAREDGWTLRCAGYGFIETGFSSGATCPVKWSTGGTGDPHAFPYRSLDQHEVRLTYDNARGTFDMTILPDAL